MTNDIVTKLRKTYTRPDPKNPGKTMLSLKGAVVVSPTLLEEAAKEIERLRGIPAQEEFRGTVDDKTKKFRIYMNRNLSMSPNKKAAQAVHAALEAVGHHPGTKVVVLDKGPTAMRKMRTVIIDSGITEVEPGSMTAATEWPEDSEP